MGKGNNMTGQAALPTWGIVMTVKEPAQLLLANLGWHLGTGATEIHLYLDDPEDPVAEALGALSRVRVMRCDPAHWHQLAPSGKRPPTHRRRQVLNANHALAHCDVEWLIHLDADEFLVQDRPVAEELAVVQELDCELFFPVSERVFERDAPVASIFSGVFRTSTKGLNRRGDGLDNDKVIFGAQEPLLVHGLLSHSAGKCAVPRGGDYRIGIHWAFRGTGRQRAERYQSTSTRLLHFDGLTRLHWLSKLLRYAEVDPKLMGIAPHRLAQIERFQQCLGSADEMLEFHAELREWDAARLARLRAFGLLDERRFDPAPVIREVLGALPDLTPATFDAALRAENPARLDRLT